MRRCCDWPQVIAHHRLLSDANLGQKGALLVVAFGAFSGEASAAPEAATLVLQQSSASSAAGEAVARRSRKVLSCSGMRRMAWLIQLVRRGHFDGVGTLRSTVTGSFDNQITLKPATSATISAATGQTLSLTGVYKLDTSGPRLSKGIV